MSVVRSAAGFDPTGFVTLLRIPMRPMNDSAFVVPFELAMQLDVRGRSYWYSSRQIDIVRHQKSLAGCQPDDESLMPRPVIIIRQDAVDDTFFEPALRIVRTLAFPRIPLMI